MASCLPVPSVPCGQRLVSRAGEGSPSLPSGDLCGVGMGSPAGARTMRPVSASQTTILHDWVEGVAGDEPTVRAWCGGGDGSVDPRTRLSTGRNLNLSP